MTEPAPDTNAHLQRRVLLTGVVTMVLFLAIAVAITSTGLADWMLLPAVVLLFVLVVRPMMQPVRDAVRLRRDLAYLAHRDPEQADRG